MTIRPTRALLALGLIGATMAASATEYGTVVSVTPMLSAVPIPQQECSDQPVVYQRPTTGAGALIGGIAGAAIGNTAGAGAGRALATGIGLIAGSAIGNQVEANGAPPVASTVRQCRTVTRYENRTIGYDVVYDYQGVRRHTQLARDPGERVALNVNVAPADAGPAPLIAQAPAVEQGLYAPEPQGVYYAPTPQVVYADVYPQRYYANPWPVIGLGIGYGYGWGGAWGGWHGHRR